MVLNNSCLFQNTKRNKYKHILTVPLLQLLSRISHFRLCDPIDSSPPGSPVPGILQARTLEWVAISFSNAWKWKVKGKSLSHVWLLATPWTAAYQAPPYMGISRQEDWSGVPVPPPNSVIRNRPFNAFAIICIFQIRLFVSMMGKWPNLNIHDYFLSKILKFSHHQLFIIMEQPRALASTTSTLQKRAEYELEDLLTVPLTSYSFG